VTGRVVVVGLGPGDPRLVSGAANEAIAATPHRYVRTTRHPSAHLVDPAISFDELYDRAETIDEVYAGIVDTLAAEAARLGTVLYAVPGSPYVAERTVELMRADGRVEVSLIPSLSFLDLAWDRIGVDPLEAGAVLVDGHSFGRGAAGRQGPFLVGQCDSRFVLSDIKLATDDGPVVTVLQRLGLPDEAVFEVAWEDLDRMVDPDHLTSLWIPALDAPVAAELTRFAELVRTLRAECPWDHSQTHQSLTRHLIEETYEVLDAIAGLDGPAGPGAALNRPAGPGAALDGDRLGYAALEEELGDLLFQVAFHATLAAEAGEFDLSDVARGIHDKLVARHPHVFGPPGHPVPNWEEQKKAEKGRTSVMEGVPGHLPALLLAFKIQSKAASVGFDWKNATDAWPKIDEELAELRFALDEGPSGREAVNEELGDVLFSVVNIARHLGVDPESSLRGAAMKFRSRFVAMEALAQARDVAIDDNLWDEVKKRGQG
jgi:tetrapyrrole methylase family protein/MazG family protein